jgi:hypothetical protein
VFDRPDGERAPAIEGAHSAPRVLHAADATGRRCGPSGEGWCPGGPAVRATPAETVSRRRRRQ